MSDGVVMASDNDALTLAGCRVPTKEQPSDPMIDADVLSDRNPNISMIPMDCYHCLDSFTDAPDSCLVD